MGYVIYTTDTFNDRCVSAGYSCPGCNDKVDGLPPKIDKCADCGYAVQVSTKLYVGNSVHRLIYCGHHDVLALAERMPCEWAFLEQH